ncbi:MAG: hypothetical protein QOG67_596 [Verrucomicrobiota bacterium]|jgi:hypothetical protein
MLSPKSRLWTRGQRWLICGAVLAGLVAFSALVYSYERYYRGPDDSVFIGTWRGEADYTGEQRTGYRFKPDHTYQELIPGDSEFPESSTLASKWHAGGDFLYLRVRCDDASGPYDFLQAWHIDAMTSTELRMHWEGLHASLKRVE